MRASASAAAAVDSLGGRRARRRSWGPPLVRGLPVAVPEKYADVGDGVRLFAARGVSCALLPAGSAPGAAGESTLVWEYPARGPAQP